MRSKSLSDLANVEFLAAPIDPRSELVGNDQERLFGCQGTTIDLRMRAGIEIDMT